MVTAASGSFKIALQMDASRREQMKKYAEEGQATP